MATRDSPSLRTGASLTLFFASAFLFIFVSVSSQYDGCEQHFTNYFTAHPKEASPLSEPHDMLYFLHVPRTGGRTFHSCFLKAAHSPMRRCPKAYDHLRINTELPKCYLLSSHDDFSVVSMLPEHIAVVTQFRDPVDRFLSAYEFAVELAARHANSNRSAIDTERTAKSVKDKVTATFQHNLISVPRSFSASVMIDVIAPSCHLLLLAMGRAAAALFPNCPCNGFTTAAGVKFCIKVAASFCGASSSSMC